MKCPGQDTRQWTAGAVFETECPHCGEPIEFFKDETTRKCRACGHKAVNPKMDFGCAAYCRFADQCLGELPPELVAQREELLKDRVAVAVKKRLRREFQRVALVMKTARHAERIVMEERGDPAVVLCAAYLANFELNGGGRASTAREILEELGAREALIDEVCGTIEALAGDGEVPAGNAAILSDAVAIARAEMDKELEAASPEEVEGWISENVQTEAGRGAARSTLAGDA